MSKAMIVVPAAKFDAAKLTFGQMTKNKGFGHGMPLFYDGGRLVLQVGPELYTNGLSRWNQSMNKYAPVESAQDCDWAFNGNYNNLWTAKIGGTLRLPDHTAEGTAGYYAYRAVKTIKDAVCKFVATNAWKDSGFSAEMIQKMTSKGSLEEPATVTKTDGTTVTYDPKLKFNVRYFVKDGNGRTVKVKDTHTKEEKAKFTLALDNVAVLDSDGEEHEDKFAALRGGSKGRWLVAFDSVYSKTGETDLSITCELIRAQVEEVQRGPPKVGFVDDETGAPLSSNGCTFEKSSGAAFGATEPPPLKRHKVEGEPEGEPEGEAGGEAGGGGETKVAIESVA